MLYFALEYACVVKNSGFAVANALKNIQYVSLFLCSNCFFPSPVKCNYTNILDHLKFRVSFVRRRHIDVLLMIMLFKWTETCHSYF
jgi:hypothetical protein